jgi:hypothetical protein
MLLGTFGEKRKAFRYPTPTHSVLSPVSTGDLLYDLLKIQFPVCYRAAETWSVQAVPQNNGFAYGQRGHLIS